MKKLFVTLAVAAVTGLGISFLTRALAKPSSKYECAIIKWDGPDRLFFISRHLANLAAMNDASPEATA